MTRPELRDLLEYLGQEQACYTSLLDLSRRQRETIETGDIDTLLKLLAQKQQVLSKVGVIEENLLSYKRHWEIFRQSLDSDDRQVLDLALSTVAELLNELISLEKESERLLSGRRDRVLYELEDAIRGQTVHEKYSARPPDQPPRFLDIRNP